MQTYRTKPIPTRNNTTLHNEAHYDTPPHNTTQPTTTQSNTTLRNETQHNNKLHINKKRRQPATRTNGIACESYQMSQGILGVDQQNFGSHKIRKIQPLIIIIINKIYINIKLHYLAHVVIVDIAVEESRYGDDLLSKKKFKKKLRMRKRYEKGEETRARRRTLSNLRRTRRKTADRR